MQRQLAFILARANVPSDWIRRPGDDEMELPEDLLYALTNMGLSTHLRAFGKELGAEEPKTLEDIYKSHLEHSRTQYRFHAAKNNDFLTVRDDVPTGVVQTVDSARANLAGTFVNAFVNAGFGNDPLMVGADEGAGWIYKNKDHGMLSASASVGLSCLWDVEEGLGKIDKYTYSNEEYIKVWFHFYAVPVRSNVTCGHSRPAP
jgi:26S proteasome regulatory subunit N1